MSSLLRSAQPLAALPSHVVRRVAVIHPVTGEQLDDAMVTVMRAPRSYTGEDVVELSCHGNPALLRLLLSFVIEAGARLAEPGEFTRRAYLNGRLDLAQAEAVALLIGARTERAVALAARALAGGLSGPLTAVREALLDLVAGLELTLDFPDEQIAVDEAEARKTLAALRETVRRQLASARSGDIINAGLTVAIVGPPNAGKSSLLNGLLGRERAIVSPHAGTTRDVVEGAIVVAGVPVRLLDTAGLGDPQDPIDAEGMRRSRLAIEDSDLVLVVLDRSAAPQPGVLTATADRRRIIVAAKCDLQAHPQMAALADAVLASVKLDGGLDALIDRLTGSVEELVNLNADEGPLLASLRQIELLGTLHASLERAERALAEAPLEVALIELNEGLRTLAAMLGHDVGDEVLDRIFSRFCVGK